VWYGGHIVDAVLFDFDFTLADSSAGAAECANYALCALGFQPAEPEVVRRTVGLSLKESFRLLTGSDDISLATAYSQRFVERADQVMEQLTRLYAEVPGTLEELRRRRIRIAVVSTKFRYRIQAILRRELLVDAVDVIVGGEDVAQHKPHPEGLQRALALLNTDPSHAVYVGDHPVDAEAASRARVPFIGVLMGASSAASFGAFAPVGIIENVAGLSALLANLA